MMGNGSMVNSRGTMGNMRESCKLSSSISSNQRDESNQSNNLHVVVLRLSIV